jgi:hypothetical protein
MKPSPIERRVTASRSFFLSEISLEALSFNFRTRAGGKDLQRRFDDLNRFQRLMMEHSHDPNCLSIVVHKRHRYKALHLESRE